MREGYRILSAANRTIAALAHGVSSEISSFETKSGERDISLHLHRSNGGLFPRKNSSGASTSAHLVCEIEQIP